MKANIYTTIGVVTATVVAAWFVVTPSEGSPLWNSPQIVAGLIFIALLLIGALVAKLSRIELMVGGFLLVVALQVLINPVSRFLRSLDQYKTKPSPALVTKGAGPDIQGKCAVNGFGKANCSFSNKGVAKGSLCVVIKFHDPARPVNQWDGKRWVITSDEFCSGLVEASDVRDREGRLSFSDPYGNRVEPAEFCRNGSGSWPFGCVMEVVEAPYRP